MKKLLSIIFALVIILSGMHVTIATHYCHGKIAFTKFSVSGELASCGMEGASDKCSFPVKLKTSNCCKDKVAPFVVDSNYSSTFSEFKSFPQHVLHVFVIPDYVLGHAQQSLNFHASDVSPPGYYLVSDVSLPDICVFRI